MATKQSLKSSEGVAKDRVYVLKTKNPPLQFFLKNRHKKQAPLQYYDEEKGLLRSLCYASNQVSIFTDEQTGDVLVSTISFINGKLTVPKSNPQLQLFLRLTPDAGVIFEEHKPDEIAEKQLSIIELEYEAIELARELKTTELESIALSVFGSAALKQKTSEIKRDVWVYAKENPADFLALAKDETTKLKGIAVRAESLGLCQYKANAFYNQDTLLCRVPFDETDRYSTMARWMDSTEDGKAFLKYVETKIK